MPNTLRFASISLISAVCACYEQPDPPSAATEGATDTVTDGPSTGAPTASSPTTTLSSDTATTDTDDASTGGSSAGMADTSGSPDDSTGPSPAGCGGGVFDSASLPYAAVTEIGVWGSVGDVALADLDDDGAADLVVTDITQGGLVRVLMGQGGGSFGAPSTLDGSHLAFAVAVGAISDAVPDLVAFVRPNAGSTGSVLRRWRGDGSGAFLTHADQSITASGEDATLADLDGDARLDAVTGASTAIDVLRGTAAEGFQQAVAYPTPWVYAVTTGDVDGDGVLDVIAATSEGLYVFGGGGDGTLQDPAVYGTRSGRGVGTGDFNGDGHTDVAVGSDAIVEVYFGDGAGGLQGPQELTVLGPVNDLDTPDLDGDGCSDIVIASGSDTSASIGVIMSLGDDAFAFETPFATAGFEGCPTSIATADIDGDDIPDVVVGTACGASVGRVLALASG